MPLFGESGLTRNRKLNNYTGYPTRIYKVISDKYAINSKLKQNFKKEKKKEK